MCYKNRGQIRVGMLPIRGNPGKPGCGAQQLIITDYLKEKMIFRNNSFTSGEYIFSKESVCIEVALSFRLS
jgi:hypothetical protein